ncbi:MAG: hypothetical protein AB3N23_22000 [Paracoccaceae bacterium]
MTRAAAALLLFTLAACGADGEPVPPEPTDPPPVQRTLNTYVGVGSGGNVHVGGALGLHRGPISLYLGF